MTETDPDPAREVVAEARSLLFVPGDRPERFGKAAATAADLVICDLEDAVAAEAKSAAREAVVDWVSGSAHAAVRINAADTPAHEGDVAALSGMMNTNRRGLLTVIVPMAEDPAQLSATATALGIGVVALVETAVGMDRARQLAQADGVVRLAFGHLDYAMDLGSGYGRDALLHARATLVLASRVAGLPGPVDGVTTSLDDRERAADDARYARELGFDGKFLIHPNQVEPVNDAFSPSADDIAWADRVLEADEQGRAVRVDGEMIEAPVVARAHRIRQRARR